MAKKSSSSKDKKRAYWRKYYNSHKAEYKKYRAKSYKRKKRR